MAFNQKFYQGTTSADLKKLFNYGEFLISNEEAEKLIEANKLLRETHGIVEVLEEKNKIVDLIPTIKNVVISND